MSGHTPGPWLLAGRTVYALNAEGVNRFSALVQDAHAPAYELNANAHLISAAPDLLEALEMAMEIGDQCSRGFLGKFQAKARAAIAKARGEQ
jgi:hypothetical protein